MTTQDFITIINRLQEDFKLEGKESDLGTVTEVHGDGTYSVNIGGKEFPALNVKSLYPFDLALNSSVYVGYPASNKFLPCILGKADIEIPEEEEEIDINPPEAAISGKVYIVDDGNSRIQVLDSSYNFVLKVSLS